jgi:CBS domain containing-hemolysin-like protein
MKPKNRLKTVYCDWKKAEDIDLVIEKYYQEYGSRLIEDKDEKKAKFVHDLEDEITFMLSNCPKIEFSPIIAIALSMMALIVSICSGYGTSPIFDRSIVTMLLGMVFFVAVSLVVMLIMKLPKIISSKRYKKLLKELKYQY